MAVSVYIRVHYVISFALFIFSLVLNYWRITII